MGDKRKPRFVLVRAGGYRSYIDDDEFHWDALLRCSGDFEDDDEKARYMQAVVDVLNRHADEIPHMPVPG